MKTSRIIGALGVGIILLSVFYYSQASHTQKNERQSEPPPTQKVSALSVKSVETTTPGRLAFNNINSSIDRNIGKVEQFLVQNASGTVILIPQQHQSPGTDASDGTNDLAELTQNQIYEIITELRTKLGLSFVMAEGDMFGQVPDQKISYLTSLMNYRDQLANYLSSFSTSTPKTEQIKILTTDLAAYIRSINREITLAGAPYKMKAEGTPLTIYGIENKKTVDESANAVRDYVYLQDRASELSTNKNDTLNSISTLERAYLALFPSKTPIQQIASDLSMMQRYPLSTKDQTALTNIAGALRSIVSLKQSIISTSTLPSRSDNPYKNINNVNTLNSLLKKADAKIQSIIIDRRNAETAINIQNVMSTNHLPSLILQLGAGHESGIVKDLNAEGLSVVVVTPAALVGTSSR